MWQRAYIPLLACLLLIAPGCAKEDPLAPGSLSSPRISNAHSAKSLAGVRAPSVAADQISGEIGPGAEYALFRPENWNGDLVLYAHGYIPEFVPVGIPASEGLGEHLVELRDLLLERGFAVGYSSYSENGFAVKEGALWTDQLREIFVSKFGRPERTFLIGTSMGALAALKLVEQHPDQYAGALEVAGVLGGSRRAIAYYAHIRVLFDCFYPGVLPGSLLELPEGTRVQEDVINPALAAMLENSDGAAAISQFDQTPVPYRSGSGPELIQSILLALGFHAIALNDLLDRMHGHSLFDNRETVYSSSTLPPEVVAQANACVARYSIDPDAAAYLKQYYEPTGRLSIPVLTMHMRYDPIAPLFHEMVYHDLVASQGRIDFLRQTVIEGYGHPGIQPPVDEITGPMMADAFADLVEWVNSSARPARRIAAGP